MPQHQHPERYTSELQTDFSAGFSPPSAREGYISTAGYGTGLGSSPGFGAPVQQQRMYNGPTSPPLTSPLSPQGHRTSFSSQGPHTPTSYLPTPTSARDTSLSDLGKGVPLHAVPPSCPLYIVEFKAGRTDLFYTADRSQDIRTGDIVIVEADRGKDLGKVVNDSITLAEVEAYQKVQAEKAAVQQQMGMSGGEGMGGGIGGMGGGPPQKKDINPKQIYGKAGPQDTQ